MTEIHRKLSLSWWKNEAKKPVVTIMVMVSIMAICAVLPQFFSWSGVITFITLYILTGLGITLCYHRLLTHKSFKTSKLLRKILTFFGCLAMQGPPIVWVGTHRQHHKYSDGDKDPHTPQHGFTWSHYIWTISKSSYEFEPSTLTNDLNKEPFMVWLGKFYWFPQIILVLVLAIIGWVTGGLNQALSLIFWGVGLRTFMLWNFTWFVNSAAHTWGYKNFKETGDNSRNLWWVALFAFGEGWHNNHHGEQKSAAHGMRWFELDPTYWVINMMSWVGLASDIVRPKKMKLEK
jgi:fatty-acid desaturase